MSAVTHPPFAARRTSARAATWWGKAWVRALEESAYDAGELRAARTLARSGAVGGITVDVGSIVAAVDHRGELHPVRIELPVLDDAAVAGFVELVSAEAGRIAALAAGELPHQLVEHAEESGVELLPYGGELDASCTCSAWTPPCVHALAVMYQVTWLLDADPFVLLHVRGLPRNELVRALHDSGPGGGEGDDSAGEMAPDPDLDLAYDAALLAARLLEDS